PPERPAGFPANDGTAPAARSVPGGRGGRWLGRAPRSPPDGWRSIAPADTPPPPDLRATGSARRRRGPGRAPAGVSQGPVLSDQRDESGVAPQLPERGVA